jgi:hypothetical protein
MIADSVVQSSELSRMDNDLISKSKPVLPAEMPQLSGVGDCLSSLL